MKDTEKMLTKVVKDLENTRHKYGGYPYVRTIRNILVGKADAAIAPYFATKPYYGMFYELTLKETEDLLDKLVSKNKLDTIFTGHGKMYCSVEEYYY